MFAPDANSRETWCVGSGMTPQEAHGRTFVAHSTLFRNRRTSLMLQPLPTVDYSSASSGRTLFSLSLNPGSSLLIACICCNDCISSCFSISAALFSWTCVEGLFSVSSWSLIHRPASPLQLPWSFKRPEEIPGERSVEEAPARACRRAHRRERKASCSLTPRLLSRSLCQAAWSRWTGHPSDEEGCRAGRHWKLPRAACCTRVKTPRSDVPLRAWTRPPRQTPPPSVRGARTPLLAASCPSREPWSTSASAVLRRIEQDEKNTERPTYTNESPKTFSRKSVAVHSTALEARCKGRQRRS